ncbi:MAG: HNH endonuclease [Solirubrobacteraceae bacterium]
MSRNHKRGNGSARKRKRERIFARDGGVCLRCGSDEDLTLDHITPISEGGSNRDENLQTLCLACNEAKGTQSFSYLAKTWERAA